MQGMIYEVEFSLYIDCRLKLSRNRVVVSGCTIINATKCELEDDLKIYIYTYFAVRNRL